MKCHTCRNDHRKFLSLKKLTIASWVLFIERNIRKPLPNRAKTIPIIEWSAVDLFTNGKPSHYHSRSLSTPVLYELNNTATLLFALPNRTHEKERKINLSIYLLQYELLFLCFMKCWRSQCTPQWFIHLNRLQYWAALSLMTENCFVQMDFFGVVLFSNVYVYVCVCVCSCICKTIEWFGRLIECTAHPFRTL